MLFDSVMTCEDVSNNVRDTRLRSRYLYSGNSHTAPTRAQSHVSHTMTTEFTPDDELSSTEEFEAALGRVILAALENDIDPLGTWEYRANKGSDMEVMVVELAD